MSECCFAPSGIIGEIFLCGFACPTSVFAVHEEVLEGALFVEAQCIVQGGCTPGFDLVDHLTVSDYAKLFANVLR